MGPIGHDQWGRPVHAALPAAEAEAERLAALKVAYREGQESVRQQLAGAVDLLDEALNLAAEALDVPAGYARHLKHLREKAHALRVAGGR